MYVHDRIQAVVRTRQQYFRLCLLDKCFEFLQGGAQFIRNRLAFPGKFDERLNVIGLACKLFLEVESFFKAGALLERFTGSLLIGPELWIVDQFLQIVELPLLPFSVKGTSGRPGRGS
jgi:hypothetical protein